VLPFALHLGWISVAAVANVNISLVAAGAQPSAQVAGAILTLFCPVAFALWSAVYRFDSTLPVPTALPEQS
jgi:hypothetical protein